MIAVGLAMDALAVTVVMAATSKRLQLSHVLRAAGFFGLFQALMPLIGSLAGLGVRKYVETFDHWIALILLCAVGGKMIYESFKLESKKNPPDFTSLTVLLVLAIATSIDALAVGFSVSFLNYAILPTVTIIGVVTFAVCFAGAYISRKIARIREYRIEFAGGIILIGIGFYIFFEHVCAG
jgi:putative Mn2+ efflux pump MntP